MVKIIRAILVQRGVEDEGCFVCVDLLKNRTIILFKNKFIEKEMPLLVAFLKHFFSNIVFYTLVI